MRLLAQAEARLTFLPVQRQRRDQAMPKRIFLHIGPHKTGTSGLQAMFADRRAHLAEAGVLYPGPIHETAHHALVHAIRAHDTLTLRRFTQDVADAETVLFSSELFGLLSQQEVEVLRRMFPQAEVTVVGTLRPLQELWPSHWRELIKHGHGQGFVRYLGDVPTQLPPDYSLPIRVGQILRRYETVFGQAALKLLNYPDRDAGTDIGVAFAQAILGLENATGFATQRANLMPSHWQVEIGRLCHQVAKGTLDHVARKRVFSWLINHLTEDLPSWALDLRAAYGAVEPVRLSEKTPLVAQQTQDVLSRYGARLEGASTAFTRPLVTETRCLDLRALPENLVAVLQSIVEVVGRDNSDFAVGEPAATAFESSVPMEQKRGEVQSSVS